MKVALVADWLTIYGGAEHAITEFKTLWPDAPLFTTVAAKEKLGPLSSADIRTSHLQKWYKLFKNHQALLPWMPAAIEAIDTGTADVIVSSSHAVAKGIVPVKGAIHVCYCHTPMRYAWEMEETYLKDFRVPGFLRKRVKRELVRLRRWDLTTSKRVDAFIANSKETQNRIKRIYGRESAVIPPPVDEKFFERPLYQASNRSRYLAVGRMVPYKRFDLLIELANKTGMPLSIAGRGQDEARLKAMAGPTVDFLGYVQDDRLAALYGTAKALLFPQYEDAGIVPLEAQACGTPVIAYAKGGALDSVIDGTTGILFADQTVEALKDALERFEKISFDPQSIRAHAMQFSASNFRRRMQEEVERAYGKVRG